MTTSKRHYEQKPLGLYKTAFSDYSCSECAYREAKKCNLRNITLNPYELEETRCRDHLHSESGTQETPE